MRQNTGQFHTQLYDDLRILIILKPIKRKQPIKINQPPSAQTDRDDTISGDVFKN